MSALDDWNALAELAWEAGRDQDLMDRIDMDKTDSAAHVGGGCVGLGLMVLCYATCWACKFNEHHNPRAWHTWADAEDVEHAERTGQADPREQRCGCACAKAERVVTP